MATIREVAKLAGVSPATVSRVINGTAKVDERKRQAVLAAISETGFKPNELARALFKHSSKIIGVIIPDIENPFFSEAAKAIEAEAFTQGYKILLCYSDHSPEKEAINIQMLVQMKADGIIIMTNGEDTGKNIANCELPIVVMDRRFTSGKKVASIEADHYKGGWLAAEHLVQCGCKKIICLRAPQKYSSSQERYRAYVDICEKYNREPLFLDCDYSYESGLIAAKEIMAYYPDADGILASNDIAAMAVYKILTQAGYKIPDDIQLIGFDDISFSWRLTPELTTIHQPICELGQKAVQLILQDSASQNQENLILDVSLIERQTTHRTKGGFIQ